MIFFYCDTGAGESRETGGSVKGRAESIQGLITEAAAQQQNPEPQVRNETDEDESVDSFEYFARPQSQNILFFFLIILIKPLILLYQKFSIAKMEPTASG